MDKKNREKYRRVLEKLFDTLDKDNNEFISWSEFVEFQVQSRQTLEESWKMDLHSLRREFRELDSDGNGRISRREFIEVMTKLHGATARGIEALEEMLRKIHRDSTQGSNSSVDNKRESFVRGLMKRFDDADVDHDGQITFSEFIRNEWASRDGEDERRTVSLKELRREFRRLDEDGNGAISRAEFQRMAEKVYDASRH